MIRLGLCCAFTEEPIQFRTTTAAFLSRMSASEAEARLSALCAQNAETLLRALQFCADNRIGSFRINSGILPLKTHPAFRYELEKLPEGRAIRRRFEEAGEFARANGVRTVFHPDQFVVLNSARPEVVANSIEELEYQAGVAEWVGADVINIHAGGAFGNKTEALKVFRRNLKRLSRAVLRRLTLENDDRMYAPSDLLPFCRAVGLPFVYDVHHHRCNPGVEPGIPRVTAEALATWNREPLFHISSPIEGWKKPNRRLHHDFINIRDFPAAWRALDVTVEVEAKAKELAVLKLAGQLGYNRRTGRSRPAGAPDRPAAAGAGRTGRLRGRA
jgi:UV DNA damage endonuclease